LGRHKVTPVTGRVVVIDFEMATDDPNQLDDWYRALKIKHADRVVIMPMRGRGSAFNILDPDTRTEWAKALQGDGLVPETCYVVLDCVRPAMDALGLKENFEAGVFLDAFGELLLEAGISEALVLHHMGHQDGANGKIERGRGDSRLQDWP